MKCNQHLHSLCGLAIHSSIKEDGSMDHKSNESIPLHLHSEQSLNIGIIGGGLGGRVYIHKFSSVSYQYFEVGALKLPFADNYMPVFNLIDYINFKNH